MGASLVVDAAARTPDESMLFPRTQYDVPRNVVAPGWRAGMLAIECESSATPVRPWARVEQTVHVVEMIRRTNARDLSKP